MESALIERFTEHKYNVQIVEKNTSKNYCEKYIFLNKLCTNLFKKYWLNEHRPQFNRWIIVTNK